MDLGSRNGTYVNGQRVIMPVILENGAVIRVSNNEMTFEQNEAAAPDSEYDLTVAADTDAFGEGTTTVSLMVCDIRSFSAMSEILPEDILARTLGQWFRDAGNIVQNSGGIIDKFIGDSVLAYWVQGPEKGREAERTLSTARSLLERASSQSWPEHPDRPFQIAIALHHGVVTCGNVGLVAQRDATIIGDAVNTVFRMEGLTKTLGQRLSASGDFISLLEEDERSSFKDLGEHQLRGKNQLVRIYGLT